MYVVHVADIWGYHVDVYMWNITYLYTMGCNRGDWEYLQCDLLTCGTLGMNIVEYEHEEFAHLECSTCEHCIRRMLNICTLYLLDIMCTLYTKAFERTCEVYTWRLLDICSFYVKTAKYVCNWPMVIRDGQNIDFVYEVCCLWTCWIVISWLGTVEVLLCICWLWTVACEHVRLRPMNKWNMHNVTTRVSDRCIAHVN